MNQTLRCRLGASSPQKFKLNLYSVSILVLILIHCPDHAAGTITIISELFNTTVATINDLPARFIPERFSFYGIQGYVIASEPENACSKVKPPPDRDPPDLEYPINWILLARRSPECHFQTKIENAQNAGYTAIIIHNVDSNSTEIMGVEDPSKIIIYATFVGSYDGQLLKNHTYGSQYFIRIQDDFSINGYLLPFAIVVGLCFIVMIIFMVRLLWQQILRWIRDRRRSRRRKLPASALKKIPTQKWTKGDPYETCAVCLDDFVEQDKIRVLPCAHGFHMKCIDPWLTKGRRVCPICKRKVIVADERFNRADSDTDTEDDSAPLLGASSATSPSPAGRNSGEETFVQGQGETSSTSSTDHGSPSLPHLHLTPQNFPRVHNTRASISGVLNLIRSRHQNQNQTAAPPADSASTSTSRPRPRPVSNNIVNIVKSRSLDSDSSSLSSVGSGLSPSHHAVLAEVHHSTEVLRQRLSGGDDELVVEPTQGPTTLLPDLVSSNPAYPAPEEGEDVQILVVSDKPGGSDDSSANTCWDAFSSRDQTQATPQPTSVDVNVSSSTPTTLMATSSHSVSEQKNPIV